MDKAADYKEDTGADLVGINMEGPFINLKKAGAQNPEYIMPDAELHPYSQKISCLPRSCSPSVPHSVYFFQNDPPVR